MKWQTKKPAKKYRGKKRTVKKTTYKYSYIMASNSFAIKTKVKNTCSSHTYNAATCTSPKTCSKCGTTEGSALGHNWGAWYVDKPATTSAEGAEKRTCARCGYKETRSIPKITNITPTTVNPEVLKSNPYKGWDDDPYAIGSTVTVWAGIKTRTFKKTYKNYWESQTDSEAMALTDDSLLCYYQDVDGKWTYGGESRYNKSGARFNLDCFGSYDTTKDGGGCYMVKIYNCDYSKLEVIPESYPVPEETYTNERSPKKTTVLYYKKNNSRIAMAPSDGSIYKIFNDSAGTKIGIVIPFYTHASSGTGLGFYTDIFKFTIKYDGQIIGTINADSTQCYWNKNWTVDTCGGMSPVRKVAWDIAREAIPKGQESGDLATDLTTICRYLENTTKYSKDKYVYYNGDPLFTMNCAGSAIVLETYAFFKYNEYGFVTPRGGDDNHKSYSPMSMPESNCNVYN